jgi:hypothetical protein
VLPSQPINSNYALVATHLNRLKVELIWALNGYANPVGTGKSQDQTLNKTEPVGLKHE